MMKAMPTTVRPFNRTAEFDATSVPPGLLREHQTKPDVWGMIHVLNGTVRYAVPSAQKEYILDPERPGIVEPGVIHRVEPSEDATFFVEFWR